MWISLLGLTIDTTIPIFRIHLCAIFESQNHPEKCNSSLLSSPHRWNFPILVKMVFLPNNISRVLISHAWYQSQCPVIPVLWNLVDHLLETEILVVVVLSFWAKAVGGCSGEQHFQHGGVSWALNVFNNSVVCFVFDRIHILHSDPSMYQIKQINLQYMSLTDEGASAEQVVHISAKFSLHFVMNVMMAMIMTMMVMMVVLLQLDRLTNTSLPHSSSFPHYIRFFPLTFCVS